MIEIEQFSEASFGEREITEIEDEELTLPVFLCPNASRNKM